VTYDPIIVDKYSEDSQADWDTLAASGLPWAGGILKATQGLTFSAPDWLAQNWAALETARTRNFRTNFIRGAYHYYQVADDGCAQAKFFLSTMNKAGGYQLGDLWPIIDVEADGNGNPSAQQIVDGVCAFVETIATETGMPTMLYGNEFLFSQGVTSRMGCSWLWVARYTATLPQEIITRIGWTEDALWGWQYRGDAYNALLETPDKVLYPNSAPGCGTSDLTVLTFPGGLDALCAKLWAKK
jgi:GH25 family lysozyme M1 (1,4-beta-N-acetylmuramidase)